MSTQLTATSLNLPATTSELTQPQLGWLSLANIKADTFAKLQAGELAVQEKLSEIETEQDLPKVQERIKLAKEIAAENKERRLYLTRDVITAKIINPAMEFEKRSEELITKAGQHEFSLRKAASSKADEAEAYNKECAALKSHIANEHLRRQVEYKNTLRNHIVQQYKECLNRRTVAAHIKAVKDDVKAGLKTITLSKFIPFNRIKVDQVKANEIFASVAAYTPESDYNDAIEFVDTFFETYTHDLKNAAAASAAIDKETEQINQQEANNLATSTAVNTLVAQAGVVVEDRPTIKRKMDVVVDDKNIAWCMCVLANAIKNWQVISTYFQVKAWSKLNVGQMAAALGKLVTEFPDIQLEGLTLKEVEK